MPHIIETAFKFPLPEDLAFGSIVRAISLHTFKKFETELGENDLLKVKSAAEKFFYQLKRAADNLSSSLLDDWTGEDRKFVRNLVFYNFVTNEGLPYDSVPFEKDPVPHVAYRNYSLRGYVKGVGYTIVDMPIIPDVNSYPDNSKGRILYTIDLRYARKELLVLRYDLDPRNLRIPTRVFNSLSDLVRTSIRHGCQTAMPRKKASVRVDSLSLSRDCIEVTPQILNRIRNGNGFLPTGSSIAVRGPVRPTRSAISAPSSPLTTT
jgi:hypothetical protein